MRLVMCALRAALSVSVAAERGARMPLFPAASAIRLGELFANVAVDLTNRATQVKLSSVTNAEGIFVFPSVPPGTYEVNARITGFNAARIESVTLEVGSRRRST